MAGSAAGVGIGAGTKNAAHPVASAPLRAPRCAFMRIALVPHHVVLLGLCWSPCAAKRAGHRHRRASFVAMHAGAGNHTAWKRAGRSLLGAFDHITVLTLPPSRHGDNPRIQHMRSLLEDDLGIPRERVTLFNGASSREWGTWPGVAFLQQQRRASANWWMAPRLCAVGETTGLGGPDPPPCLQAKYARCLQGPVNGTLVRMCNELCYTLSVVSALDDFLRHPERKRALILEDDICATPALLSADGRRRLWWLRSHESEWDLVKLGDCYRGLPVVPKRYVPTSGELLTSGTCASPGAAPSDRVSQLPNALLAGIPWGYCTHALGVSRRMARHIVQNAFPVTDVFDSLLVSHLARQHGPFRMLTLNYSVFAQVAKTGVDAPKGLRSQNHGAPVRIGHAPKKQRLRKAKAFS